jgi:hypothetical protein
VRQVTATLTRWRRQSRHLIRGLFVGHRRPTESSAERQIGQSRAKYPPIGAIERGMRASEWPPIIGSSARCELLPVRDRQLGDAYSGLVLRLKRGCSEPNPRWRFCLGTSYSDVRAMAVPLARSASYCSGPATYGRARLSAPVNRRGHRGRFCRGARQDPGSVVALNSLLCLCALTWRHLF